MSGLQRKRIKRMLRCQIGEDTPGLVPMARCETAKGRDMRLLTGRCGEHGGGGMAVARDRHRLALGGEAVEPALQHMRHDEIGRSSDRLVGRADRIADEALEFAHPALVMRGGSLVRA